MQRGEDFFTSRRSVNSEIKQLKDSVHDKLSDVLCSWTKQRGARDRAVPRAVRKRPVRTGDCGVQCGAEKMEVCSRDPPIFHPEATLGLFLLTRLKSVDFHNFTSGLFSIICMEPLTEFKC